jgi:glycosyltransferase involved in cell wall biosynthesis
MTSRRTGGPIVQIGPLPPPYGGVAVHVRRLTEILVARGLDVIAVCQAGGDAVPGAQVVALERFSWRGWLRSGVTRLRPRVVHCHEGWEWSPALVLAALGGARVVVTVHSETTMEGLVRAPWRHRLPSRLLLASSRVRWIAVSPRIGEGLTRAGARAGNVVVAPAYLPITAGAGVTATMPLALRDFVAAHHPLLSVYGWRVSTTAEGEDTYGFDLAIAALERVRAVAPGCGLVVLVPSGEPADAVDALRREAERRGLGSSVFVWTAPLPDPTPLWRATDVYLRPSRTDGDAVSVREVLALGGAVVASDCCDRPAGVRAFSAGDPASLADAVADVLSHGRDVGTPGEDTGVALAAIAAAYGLPEGFLGEDVTNGGGSTQRV